MRNGAIIYNGPSVLDRKPIVAVVTGLREKSRNPKTGNMLQSYIIRSDVHPMEAANVGSDSSVCGSCPHRGSLHRLSDGSLKNVNRTCYVNLLFGPSSVYKNLSSYPKLPASGLGDGHYVRIGSYGDPAAIPFEVWKDLIAGSKGHTGYTHQWRTCDPRYRDIIMTSADSVSTAQEAQALGWRTFRVAFPGDSPRLSNEGICPASKEAGHKLTCSECLACRGSGPKGSIVIQAHGNNAVMSAINNRIGDKKHA